MSTIYRLPSKIKQETGEYNQGIQLENRKLTPIILR